MNRLLLLNGLKRSGNHAFVEWIKANADIVFFNNVVRIGPVLRGEAPLPDALPFNRWLRRQSKIPFLSKFGVRNKDVLVSFEDVDPEWRYFSKVPSDTLSVLLLRDPYNLFASRIRIGTSRKARSFARPPNPTFYRMVELWKAHARAFLGETGGRPDVPVYYNRWFVSPDYRKHIADLLGIRNSDSGLDSVARYGGGSSFDGQGYDARGRQMAVLNRVDKLTEEERGYLAIVEDDAEVRSLYERIEAVTSG